MSRPGLALILLTTPPGATPVDGVYDGFDCTAPGCDIDLAPQFSWQIGSGARRADGIISFLCDP
jgi:hypothetical protein